jgi:hypothetical protein
MQQNEVINASICLSDIKALLQEKPERATISPSNGKMYLNINIYAKREVDKFGKDISISISQTKEEREAKELRKYIGNGETKTFDRVEPEAATPAAVDDLPF